jgi:sugar/nucleoside kinase (ribokinase family)
MAWEGHNTWEVRNCYVNKPKLSTGGGDNFNAGFCAGQLLGADVEASMILANAVSGCYIRNGHSPDINEILAFLQAWKDSINC